MLAMYTRPVVTRYSLDDIIYSLRVGLTSVTAVRPRDEVLAVAVAKVRLESGNGDHVWNDNLGNIKRADSDVGNFTCIPLNEVLSGRGLVWFRPDGELVGGASSALKGSPLPVPDGHPQTRMAHLANKVDGGYFYCDFIFKRARYAKAMQALLAGNPALYALELHNAGYYTAPVESYTKTLVALYAPSLSRIRNQPYEDVQQPSKNDWHNQLVLDGYVTNAWLDVQDDLNRGAAQHQREWDLATEVEEAAGRSDSEPNA